MVESDSKVAIQLINGGCDDFHPNASLVNQIRQWLAQDWDCRFVHTHREVNQVADCLTNMGHDLSLGSHVLVRPPPSCSNILFFDQSGVSFPRSILV